MRSLRPRLLFLLTSVAALGVWAACGSDDDASSTGGSGFDAGGTTPVADTSVPDTSSPVVVVDSGPTGPDRDAGTPVVLDAGPGVDGGIPCYAGGALEIEPNDTLAQANDLPEGSISANVLKRVLCGAAYNPGADGGDLDAGDRDWMKFQLADASTGFYVRYEGNVDVTVETDGQAPNDITRLDAGNLLFARGQDYFVRVKSHDGKTQTWKIILFQDQRAAQ